MNIKLSYRDIFRFFPEDIKSRINVLLSAAEETHPERAAIRLPHMLDYSYLQGVFIWSETEEGHVYWRTIAKRALKEGWYDMAFGATHEKVIIEI